LCRFFGNDYKNQIALKWFFKTTNLNRKLICNSHLVQFADIEIYIRL